jgi:hypothetical protein
LKLTFHLSLVRAQQGRFAKKWWGLTQHHGDPRPHQTEKRNTCRICRTTWTVFQYKRAVGLLRQKLWAWESEETVPSEIPIIRS